MKLCSLYSGRVILQRNAYVLQGVIDWVNVNKVGSTPNVVLGQSMGGVIARYALRDMEKRNESHRTSLYVSHDAPHQGAHIPLGYLYMARHALNELITTPVGSLGVSLAGGDIPVQDAKELINQPAVRQLLVNYIDSNYVLNNAEHNAWQSELRTMGYPVQTRNIALSNASHCAQGQGLTSNQRLFRLNGSAATSPVTEIILSFLNLGPLPGALLGDFPASFLGYLPGASKLSVDFDVSAFPSSGSSRIYKGTVTYKKTLLWVVGITRTITDRSFNSPSSSIFTDNFPGGVNPAFGNIPSESAYVAGFLAGYNFNLDVTSNVDFIPVASALDVGSGATTLTTTDYTRAYSAASKPTGTKAIPFVNFATSFNNTGANEIHLSFNRANGDWLASELDAVTGVDTFNCSFVCSPPTMSGSSSLCSTGTYSVLVPTGTTVTWSVSPSNAATFPSGSSSSKAFARNSGFFGSATIRAAITNTSSGCTTTVTKSVSAGGALSLSAPSFTDGSGGVSATVTGGSGTYNWYRIGFNPSSKTLLLSSSSKSVYVQFGCTGGVLSVENSGSCGFAQTSVTITQSNCGGNSSVVVSPNPASTEIFIDRVADSNGSASIFDTSLRNGGVINSEKKYMITELYDSGGNLARRQEFDITTNSRLHIDVSDLRKGNYFLKILAKEIEEVHQIIVN